MTAAAPGTSSGGDSELHHRYERLRSIALGEGAAGPGEAGLALLMRRGVRAWLEAALAAPPLVQSPPLSNGHRIPSDVRGELVRIVASMALTATEQEERT